jgi:hypothetical protein
MIKIKDIAQFQTLPQRWINSYNAHLEIKGTRSACVKQKTIHWY